MQTKVFELKEIKGYKRWKVFCSHCSSYTLLYLPSHYNDYPNCPLCSQSIDAFDREE